MSAAEERELNDQLKTMFDSAGNIHGFQIERFKDG